MYPLKILGKMQRRAAIWILGAFRTSPTSGIKAIAGLILIKFHLHKLASRSQLCFAALPKNYLIKTLIECYELKLKGLSNRTTLVLSNTRELDRVPNTK